MSRARYEIYPKRDWLRRMKYRWRYRAANGEIIASGEAYHNMSDCEHAVQLMRAGHVAPIRYLNIQ